MRALKQRDASFEAAAAGNAVLSEDTLSRPTPSSLEAGATASIHP
jgi:hypothetical protein